MDRGHDERIGGRLAGGNSSATPIAASDPLLARMLNAAVKAHQQQRFDEAEATYRLILDKYPRHADALQLLGVLQFMKGDHAEALKLLRRAVKLAPTHQAAHDNLARVLRETGNPRAALTHHRACLAQGSPTAKSLENFARTLQALERLEDAAKAVGDALALSPENGRLHLFRGRLLTRCGRLDDAIDAYLRAIAKDTPKANTGLGNLLVNVLVGIGDRERALEGLRRWMAVAPDDPIAQHLHSAFSGDAAPERASDDYLRQIFNSFATSFDKRLDQLGYRAPELIGGLIAQRLGTGAADRDVADLGCGTGLCGRFLRPYSKWLVGVDISANMLDAARQRQQYDELVEAELTTFLDAHPAVFDLSAAGDVFCYFGDLASAFASVFASLRPGALFVFTLEGDATGLEYNLQHNGRYRHAEGYSRRALEMAGFADVSVSNEILRREGREEVRGLVIDARRP